MSRLYLCRGNDAVAFRIMFHHKNHLLVITRKFSVMVPRYRLPQTILIQHLGKVEIYVCASFRIHPWSMDENPSLSCVRRVPCAARRNGASRCGTYIILLDVWLMSDSMRDIVPGHVR